MAGQAELRITELPGSALEAAHAFHNDWLGEIRATLAGEDDALVIVLTPAGYDHRDWRKAIARDLARAHAPKRVNIVSGKDPVKLTGTLSYLAGAAGVTGQYFETD